MIGGNDVRVDAFGFNALFYELNCRTGKDLFQAPCITSSFIELCLFDLGSQQKANYSSITLRFYY